VLTHHLSGGLTREHTTYFLKWESPINLQISKMSSDLREIKPVPSDENKISPARIIFFCKSCEEKVSATQTRRKFTFCCPKCKKEEIAFGTEESIKNHYKNRL
jgi:hypothetical protein